MSDVSKRVAALSAEERSALVMRLRRKGAGEEEASSAGIPRRAEGTDAPLSFAQQRLWFLDRLEPGNTAYNLPISYHLNGQLDMAALARSLNEIIRRHEALRTTFTEKDGAPVQIIAPALTVELPLTDLSMLSESARDSEIERLFEETTEQPFNLEKLPLLRGMLFKVGEDAYLIFIVMHHIITDGWSIDLFMRELATLYDAFSKGKPSPLAELPLQYADFAAWQRGQMESGQLDEQFDYWKQQLGGDLPMLEVPTDHPRPSKITYRGADEWLEIEGNFRDKLYDLSRREGATLFMTLFAAFLVLLHRYTSQMEIILGTPVAGRNRAEVENLIGFFVNTLVLRTDMSGNPTFRELLARVREVALGAYAHQDVPFEKLVEELQPVRDMSRHPFFQISFNLQNDMAKQPTTSELELAMYDKEIDKQTRYDLEFHLWVVPEGIMGPLIYNVELFEAPTIARLLGHYRTLLTGITSNPDARLSDLRLLTDAEEQQLLVEWNETSAPDAENLCVHQLFEAQAEAQPEALAAGFVGAEGRSSVLTYGELNARANQLARHLRRLGAGPEVPVGICMERSLEMLVGMLGILKAGAAYVPLDPSYPIERLSFMLEDSHALLLVTEEAALDVLPAGAGGIVVCVDSEWDEIAQEDATNLPATTHADNLAYIVYTSGSTGRPKGVGVPHRGWSNLAAAQSRVFGVDAESRVLQFASLSFDASAWEMCMTLTRGATLWMASRETLMSETALAHLLREQSITAATLPPVVLTSLSSDELPALDTLITAGEACPAETAARWMKGRRFFNAYGPTEASVCATMLQCTQTYAQGPPIGRPILNTQVYVLDDQLRPVPIGVPGELYIGGFGLARGYVNRPEFTAEKFIPNPFGRDAGARLYRTGDLARYRDNGHIEFLGRTDHQIKLRGFRIELGEIEAALRKHAGVRESIVVVHGETPVEKRLVAYVVSEQHQQTSTLPPMEQGHSDDANLPVRGKIDVNLVTQLRNLLLERMPDYMVPAAFVVLDELPLTTNGKVDRRRLPAPDDAMHVAEESFVAPRTPEEKLLVEIWAEVLGAQAVGANDNFFELGGHSLLATRIISRIREASGVELPLRLLFESPTVAGFAVHLSVAAEQQQDETKRIGEMLEKLEHLSEEEVAALLEQSGSTEEA